MRAFCALAFVAASVLAACGPSQPPAAPEPPPAVEAPAPAAAVPSVAPSVMSEAAKPSATPAKAAAEREESEEHEEANLANGQKVFNQCRACHTIEAGAGNRVGPSLHGVIGRKAGSIADFTYSPAMKGSGITWNAAALDAYLANPAAKIPGNRMTYLGVKKAEDRRDVIAYVESESKK